MLDDLYIRLRDLEIFGRAPDHLYSELDNVVDGDAGWHGENALHGVTEWALVAGTRSITFGWDWTFEPEVKRLLAQWASMRTNLMVVDADGVDMGDDYTLLCIARMMTRVRWEEAVIKKLELYRYS